MQSGDEIEVEEIDGVMRNILEQVKLPAVAFPVLDLVPDIFAPWKKRARGLFESQRRIFMANLDSALCRTHWSWSKSVLNAKSAKDCDMAELAYVIGVNYEAGSDTTAFVLETFVLASLLHKNAVTTAQAELDSVTGLRMPGWDDLPRLPYVNAFVNEVLRWRPVVPGGLHHAVIEDDYYLGFKIPKGTPIIPNHWSLELDETYFPGPETFEPKRWIENPDLPSSAFGFGRRICPGKPMARNSLSVIVARMLWAFHFDPVYDHGEKNEVDSWSMTQGISSRPKPFQVSLVPRSLAHQEVIQYQWKISEKGDEGLMTQVESGIAENRAAYASL
ncbi:unnamed protein product [Penicillium salamii]|uniref:Cytochrome P450 n=1 Tax=Penicillium salamii TaxID=1612424 RepID=A0A9W4NKJ6_9EURO|nr:unnamed protein product [Penicillium salamii]CAG8369469.1 unnamed protein product [Penicillium salamii]CAG8372710.1 unnamed protein product [Penicillium salamii]CAG8377609.1 unnamed protein product [Penicillium salamii]